MLPEEMRQSVLQFLRRHFSGEVEWIGEQRIGGSSVNRAWRIETDRGLFFLKANSAFDMPGLFEAEARGLEMLRSTETVRIPRVYWQTSVGEHSLLLLEYMAPGSPSPEFCADFGRKLARMHRTTWKAFGLDHSNYISSIRQSNAPRGDWSSFFIEERMEPLVKACVDGGVIPQSALKNFEQLYRKFDRLFPAEAPALLHGDLWYGNFIRLSSGESVLIDPAVYFGHREVDLAMTKLFGGFGEPFYSAYIEENPLEQGWEERTNLWNLYPLLVHVKLFGAEYVPQLLDHLHCFC